MKPSLPCLVTASLLDAGATLAHAGHAAAVAAAIGVWQAQSRLCLVSLLLWPALCWYASRTAIDASLFRALANDPEAGGRELDSYLGRPHGRSLEQRIAGARRLLRRTAFVAGVQIAALVGSAVTRY